MEAKITSDMEANFENSKSPAKEAILEKNIELFDNIVTQSYLRRLSGCEIKQRKDKSIPAMRWYRITKIVMEKDVFFGDILSMLYISLHEKAKNVVLVLDKKNDDKVELYLGARDFNGDGLVSGDILKAGLKGYLPGIKLEYQKSPEKYIVIEKKDEYEKLQKEKKDPKRLFIDDSFVSSVSVLASLRDDKKEHFVQGIEKLINSSSAIPVFTAYFIAENVSDDETYSMINAFGEIQTHLSPYAETQMTFSQSHTDGVSESLTKSFSESITKNISKTVTHSEGWSKSHTESRGQSSGSNLNASIIVIGAGYNENENSGQADMTGINGSDAEAIQIGLGKNQQRGVQYNIGTNNSETSGISLQVTKKNVQVNQNMDLIDKQIERLQNGLPFGLWLVATYFVAKQENSVMELANIYKGCLIGEESNLSVGAINLWRQENAKKALDYLNCFEHPHIDYEGIEGGVTPGSIVTSKELAIHLSLPQSSVPGILVREEQSFGRNVISDKPDVDSIEIGSIMHLGELCEEKVSLSIDALSKHAFITGTTGSGKSNTLYCLISKLMESGKKCLVIEPAKGEYKHVFGWKEGVSVYGSNPKQTLLLHINPFEFPENIDVYQHIDSLVEVFNACWPMYAAMPQVLSHSIIEAYKNCGWDMERSFNPNKQFPIVEDVLDSLKEYINSSDYSSNTKGDYIGSLETRLQSLCDGTVGRMLRGASISNEELFNENVIVDLSQVRSMENQSLIMGLLVLKLDEFRSSEGKGMNQPLRHVTILEEAHHLLKRTSTTQNAESSNVAGMAVEKIANSMAEMRTYGEGFIIADQSPSMLDLATIRNTNTKIIMALPEKDDRETAGKSIGLDDKHIEEISRLKTGEAVVYQTGWEEAVKAKIDEYKDENEQPWKYSLPEIIVDHSKRSLKKACYSLLDCYTSYNAELNHQELLDLLVGAEIPVGRYNKAKEKLEIMSNVKTDDIAYIDSIAYIFATIVGSEIFESAKLISDTAIFNARISRALSLKLDITNNDRINGFVNMYMKGCSLMADVPFYEGWLQTTLKNK